NPDFNRPGSIVIEPDGTVYFDTFGGNFYALDGKTGSKKRKFKMIGYVRTSPAIGSDGSIYFGSSSAAMSDPFSSGKIYALDSKTGAKKWELKTGDQGRSSPAMGADGTLYIGSKDTKIYAIKTDSKGLANSPWPMRGQNAQHTGRALKK
ncbi:MAG: PQQ-binding-like beta-propeller repeat protein, partial [Verrucomicrobiota bacterium]|nr:PQQ-binding-like beta-propeller repeat protein [Verrucomicrobiota bacterium]